MDYSSVPSFDLYFTSSGEMGLSLYSLGSEQRTEAQVRKNMTES